MKVSNFPLNFSCLHRSVLMGNCDEATCGLNNFDNNNDNDNNTHNLSSCDLEVSRSHFIENQVIAGSVREANHHWLGSSKKKNAVDRGRRCIRRKFFIFHLFANQ